MGFPSKANILYVLQELIGRLYQPKSHNRVLSNSPALPSYQSKCPAQLASTTHTRQQLETVHNTHSYVDVETRGLHAPVSRGAPGGLGPQANSASPPLPP